MRPVGRLIAEVKRLREDLHRSESESGLGRASEYRRLGELVDRVSLRAKPVTDNVRRSKLMDIVVLGMIGISRGVCILPSR